MGTGDKKGQVESTAFILFLLPQGPHVLLARPLIPPLVVSIFILFSASPDGD